MSVGRLLERFVRYRDDDAFETIVALYGPMVLAVCRGVLRDRCDAEDAFQVSEEWAVGSLVNSILRAATPVAAGEASVPVVFVLSTMAWTRAVTAAAVLGVFVVLGAIALSRDLSNAAVGIHPGPAGAPRLEPGRADGPHSLRIPAAAAEPLRADVMIDEKTERAIKSGLAWLAGQQRDDGSFGVGSIEGSIGNTSLAALALMGADSEQGRGPYRVRVEKALRYVMRNAQPAGFLSVPDKATHGPMYHHAFGVLFLAEAYVRSKRPEIREALEKAVRVIVDSQNDEGGWRYQPIRADADLSVTVCQLNALRAARKAGLDVPGRRSTPASVTSSSRRIRMAVSGTCSRGARVPSPLRGRPDGARCSRPAAPTTRGSVTDLLIWVII